VFFALRGRGLRNVCGNVVMKRYGGKERYTGTWRFLNDSVSSSEDRNNRKKKEEKAL
jgi:hypothetical protein